MKKLFLLPLLLLLGLSAGATCVASLTGTAAPQGNNLLRWSFNNTSTGTGGNAGYNTYSYSYGDNTSGSGYTILPHNYTTPGTYNVGLRISRYDSINNFALICTDTTNITITVAYTSCATSFAVTGTGLSRTFTATTPGASGAMSYSWNYGDGNSGTGSPANHTYAANGTYTVTLTAVGGGCSYTNMQTVYAYVSVPCSALSSAFTTSVNNHTVTVTDNSTNAPGYYKSYLAYNYGDGSAWTATTTHTYAAAGTYTVQQNVNWSDSATQTLYCYKTSSQVITIVNVNPIVNSISGYGSYDSSLINGAANYKVWLIRFDSATNILSAVDSLSSTSGGFISYTFLNPVAGAYLIKAAITNQTPGNAGILPTYHDSSLYWNTAQTVAYSGTGTNYANIWLKSGTVTAGPGFVSGNVSLGANKGAQNGVPDMNVYLRNSAGKAIKIAVTDVNGNFSFYSVPAGTYSIYPEHLNYTTTPAANVTVTNNFPTIGGINFHQDNTQMNIKPFGLSVINVAGADLSFTIAPNPASKMITASWNGVNAAGAHIIITSITGSIISDKTISGAASEIIDVSSLQPGIYFVRGTDALRGAAQKLVVE